MFFRYFHNFSDKSKKIAKLKLIEIFISIKNIYLYTYSNTCNYIQRSERKNRKNKFDVSMLEFLLLACQMKALNK